MTHAHRYLANVAWQRADGEAFTDQRYHRGHAWRFDGGATVAASSSPTIVPLPYSDAAAVDPEEAFVAALASCHMLFFLSHAAKAGFVVEAYDDAAEGVLARDADGRLAMTEVTLRPAVRWGGARTPTAGELAQLHHSSHEDCFLARSVRCAVRVESR